MLADIDIQGLLIASNAIPEHIESMDEDELLAELGMADLEAAPNDITVLRHVRSSAEKRAAEEIAHREKCEDFELFADLFMRVERELKAGAHQTRSFGNNVSIEVGHWFILAGQMAYVAE